MKNISIVMYLIVVTLTNAQTDRITDHSWGIAFDKPEGWTCQDIGDSYVLTSPDESGLILITPHGYNLVEQMKKDASQGIDDGNGTTLYSRGEAKSFGTNGVISEFSGTLQGIQVTATAVGLISPYGGGVTILAAAEPSTYSEHFAKQALTLAASFNFSIPKPTSDIDQIRQKLSGSKLTYLSSYSSGSSGGYNSQRVITLCADGNFSLQGNSSVYMDVGGAFGNSSDSEQGEGSWNIVIVAGHPSLRLNFSNGTESHYTVSFQSGKLFLDDIHYFLTNDPDCR